MRRCSVLSRDYRNYEYGDAFARPTGLTLCKCIYCMYMPLTVARFIRFFISFMFGALLAP